MPGEVGAIVGQSPRAHAMDREAVAPHRLAPRVERPSSLLDPARKGKRGSEKSRTIDQAGSKVGGSHEMRNCEFVASMPEVILAQEMVPQADAAVARTKRNRML